MACLWLFHAAMASEVVSLQALFAPAGSGKPRRPIKLLGELNKSMPPSALDVFMLYSSDDIKSTSASRGRGDSQMEKSVSEKTMQKRESVELGRAGKEINSKGLTPTDMLAVPRKSVSPRGSPKVEEVNSVGSGGGSGMGRSNVKESASKRGTISNMNDKRSQGAGGDEEEQGSAPLGDLINKLVTFGCSEVPYIQIPFLSLSIY